MIASVVYWFDAAYLGLVLLARTRKQQHFWGADKMFLWDKSEQTFDVEYSQRKDDDIGTQMFEAMIFSWSLAVTPTLDRPGDGKRWLSFEAVAQLPSLPDMDVIGEIEVSSSAPALLATRWARVPDNLEGYAALDLNDEGHTELRLKLFCTETCLEQLVRTLVAVFSASESSIALELELDYPGHKGPTFWVTQWQIRTLQVLRWTLRTAARRAKPTK